MKEELQLKLVEILSSIQATVGQAKDFTITQLPDVAMSYVMYGRATLTLFVLIGIFLIALAIKLWIKASQMDSYGDAGPVFIIGGAFSLIIGAIVTSVNLSEMLMVWFSPKVWILKQIAGMVK